jgi:polyisoprenoid-binding protein YceI
MKTKWTIDNGHSEIQFKVKHLAIANVTGTFRVFRGNIETENENFDNAAVEFEMETASIDTNNTQRDKDLKSNLFFDAEKFPRITFKGTVTKEHDNYKVTGDLTILATTRRVVMNVEHTGIGAGRFNDKRAGFEITGKINRKDFGLSFNLLTEAGSLVVGEEVKIQANIEAILQPQP